MTVAKIIMIQGSPLLPNSVQLSPPDSSSRSGRPSSGSNSSGDTASNSRKRRKVLSGKYVLDFVAYSGLIAQRLL